MSPYCRREHKHTASPNVLALLKYAQSCTRCRHAKDRDPKTRANSRAPCASKKTQAYRVAKCLGLAEVCGLVRVDHVAREAAEVQVGRGVRGAGPGVRLPVAAKGDPEPLAHRPHSNVVLKYVVCVVCSVWRVNEYSVRADVSQVLHICRMQCMAEDLGVWAHAWATCRIAGCNVSDRQRVRVDRS